MATVNLTRENFDQVIAENDIVLIDFWASWCGPCRKFAPIFEAAAEAHPDVVFAKVDTEAEPDLAAGFHVMSIPTVVGFREQVGLFSQAGALPSEALADLIAHIRSLDMDDIRRRMAEAEDEVGDSADV